MYFVGIQYVASSAFTFLIFSTSLFSHFQVMNGQNISHKRAENQELIHQYVFPVIVKLYIDETIGAVWCEALLSL